MATSGNKTPNAPSSKSEQEAAAHDLERATSPSALAAVIGGSVLTSVGIGLVILTVIGVPLLALFGFARLVFDGLPDLPSAPHGTVRTALLAGAVLWPLLFVGYGLRRWRRSVRRTRRIAAGEQPPRTLATFHSARFNTTEEKEAFVNPGCFGDDVVQTILDGLVEDGHEVDSEPGAEDFGWYGRFAFGREDRYDLIVSFQPADDAGAGQWWVHVERSGIPLSSNRRRRGGEVETAAAAAVHAVLARTPGVTDLRWHFDATSADTAAAA